MSDVERIVAAYLDLQRHQREFLETYVPGLAALLRKHVNDNRPAPTCAVAGHPPPGPEATGRITINGTPACAEHGGVFPLDLVDPRPGSGTL